MKKCAGCDEESSRLITWRNGKKYCPRCHEEITAISKEAKE